MAQRADKCCPHTWLGEALQSWASRKFSCRTAGGAESVDGSGSSSDLDVGVALVMREYQCFRFVLWAYGPAAKFLGQ